MNKKKYPMVNLGTASILVIFIILALVTFATLSLLSANSDYRFSRRTADNTTGYYEACNQAQHKLKLIRDTFTPSSSAGNPNQALEQEGVTMRDNKASFSIPTREGFALYVELDLTGGSSDGWYRVTRWQEQATDPWQADTSLPVLQ